jgi:succinate-acetate transporter protein
MTAPTQANPGPLGLVAFGVTTILLSLVNARVLPAGGEAVVLPLAFAFGGGTQMAAGLLEFKTGNTFGMTAFMSYGAFWIWFSLLLFLSGAGLLNLSMAGPAVGVALLLWGGLSFGFWICTFRFHLCLWLTFLFLVGAFILLGLGAATANPALSQAGGWVGLLTGLIACYTGIATLANVVSGYDVAPLGPTLMPARPRQDVS